MYFPRISCPLWDNVGKFVRAGQATRNTIIGPMGFACCVNKATDTHWQYVRISAFAQQQWLHESSPMLRYTYIACLLILKSWLYCLLSYWRRFVIQCISQCNKYLNNLLNFKLVLITNLMHNSFILQYMYYIKYLDMFRAILCSSSGGQNCIFTASGIVTLCEWPCSAPVESGLFL
jgi:hypothetical protein